MGKSTSDEKGPPEVKPQRKGKESPFGRKWPQWLANLIIGLVSHVLGGTILFWVLEHLVDWLKLIEILVIAFMFGGIAACLTMKFVPQEFKRRHLSGALAFGVMSVIVFVMGHRLLGPRNEIIRWDFENGTVQGWGIYDEEKGRVVTASVDVTTSSPKDAKGAYSLMVSNIDLLAPPKPGALKKWPAVRYEGDLSNAKVTALVYVPAGSGFRYADAKIFHFDSKWKWHESAWFGEGVHLQPGEWIELSWDLRRHKTFWWRRPWRKVLGIQIYVEGTFKGPIYIDNVVIYK